MDEDFNHCYINSLATQKYIQKNNYKKKKLSELKKRLYYIKIDEKRKNYEENNINMWTYSFIINWV